MENKEFNWDDLKQFYPEKSEEAIMTHDIYVLKNNISVGKFVKRDALTDDEKEEFAEKLNDEWIKTVVEPYCKSLYEFCKKYEIAMLKADTSLCGTSMVNHMIEEMTGGSLLNKLKNMFED